MAEPSLSATFRKPFAEQVAAWRLRLQELRPTYAWDQYEPEAHARAFMVAGATKADLLADLAGAVDRAIADGTGIEAFRRDFREITDRLGWPGKAGQGSERGFAWRTRVIYRTNMRTSYMTGRRAQLVEGGFTFWVYRHSGAAEPRLDHLAWNGLALPPDHPFWATHFPPNGWGCGCEVYGARSEAGIGRVGGDAGKALPEGWDARDPRTGAPKGIDRGWDHSVGAGTEDDVRLIARRLDAVPARIGAALAATVPAPIDAGWAAWLAATQSREKRELGLIGALRQQELDAIEADSLRLSLDDLREDRARRGLGIVTPLHDDLQPRTAGIYVEPSLVGGDKQARHDERSDALSDADWLALPKGMAAPTAVLLDTKSGKLLYLLPADGGRGQVAVEINRKAGRGETRRLVNSVVSAYRPKAADVRRRLAARDLILLTGSIEGWGE